MDDELTERGQKGPRRTRDELLKFIGEREAFAYALELESYVLSRRVAELREERNDAENEFERRFGVPGKDDLAAKLAYENNAPPVKVVVLTPREVGWLREWMLSEQFEYGYLTSSGVAVYEWLRDLGIYPKGEDYRGEYDDDNAIAAWKVVDSDED